MPLVLLCDHVLIDNWHHSNEICLLVTALSEASWTLQRQVRNLKERRLLQVASVSRRSVPHKGCLVSVETLTVDHNTWFDVGGFLSEYSMDIVFVWNISQKTLTLTHLQSATFSIYIALHNVFNFQSTLHCTVCFIFLCQ